MRKNPIVKGKVYHVFNRAIEGRNIFSFPKNCTRFLETAVLVNAAGVRPPNWFMRWPTPTPGVGVEAMKLVRIHALSLLPTHFHFLIEQLVDDGIARFLQRLCNGFAKYFNQKYNRSGSLFVGPYKAVEVVSDIQASHLFTYIHGNPLDLFDRRWREGEVKNWNKAKEFLQKYPWSSFGVYTGTETHSLIIKLIDTRFSKVHFTSKDEHLRAIKEWSLSQRQLQHQVLE